MTYWQTFVAGFSIASLFWILLLGAYWTGYEHAEKMKLPSRRGAKTTKVGSGTRHGRADANS